MCRDETLQAVIGRRAHSVSAAELENSLWKHIRSDKMSKPQTDAEKQDQITEALNILLKSNQLMNDESVSSTFAGDLKSTEVLPVSSTSQSKSSTPTSHNDKPSVSKSERLSLHYPSQKKRKLSPDPKPAAATGGLSFPPSTSLALSSSSQRISDSTRVKLDAKKLEVR